MHIKDCGSCDGSGFVYVPAIGEDVPCTNFRHMPSRLRNTIVIPEDPWITASVSSKE